MNKNLLKTIFLGVGAWLLLASSFFAPLISAASVSGGGGTNTNNYVEIPLNFTRDKPTTKASPGNCVGSTDPTNDPCIDIASGIGMYKYVGDPSPTNANIGGSNPQILVVDGTNNTTNYTKSFTVTSTGSLRIFGLTQGHQYRFNFSYVDSASPDIQKIINNMPKYCEGTTSSFANLDKTSSEWAISRNLVDGCNRYDKEPFLPGVVGVTIPSADSYATINSFPTVLQPFAIKAASPTGDVSSKTNTTDTNDCPTVDPSDPLHFIACPLLKWGSEATEKLDATIQNFLFVPPSQLFTSSMEKAWNTFRILGIALILIAGLVMVISQAAGMELFDAYTVRKVLPRLLVAAIGMALSWPLMQFVVTFFNDLGVWSHDLILAPFGDAANHATGAIVLTPILVGGAGLTYAAISLGVPGTLSLLFTLAAAALIGLFVLALRQLVIMIAVLLAPLAIAAYILPGTQKLWAFWKDTFITALVMFPIIMAFIAAGKALAVVAASTGSTEMHLLAVLVYFAPYFLLPFAFKLAGGLMATVFSIANDRSRGLFDRGRKKRQELGQQRRARAGSNSLWDPKHRLANSLASFAVDPGGNTAYYGRRVPGLRKRGQRIAGQIEHAKVEQSGKLFEEINKMGFNDKGFRALSGVHDDLSQATRDKFERAGLLNRAPRSLTELQRMGEILSESDVDTERIGGNAITASRGRLATLYQDPEMTKADIGAAGIMGLAAHGFASAADLSKAGNSLMHGRKEEAGYAQSVIAQAQLMGARSRPDVKPGYGVLYDGATGQFVDGMKYDGGLRSFEVVQTFNPGDIQGAKGGLLRSSEKNGIRDTFEYILQNGNSDAAQRAKAEVGAATPEQKLAMRKTAEGQEKLKLAMSADLYAPIKDEFLQTASFYSHASADIKTNAIDILRSSGIDPSESQRGGWNPLVEGGPEPPEPPQGGGNQGR